MSQRKPYKIIGAYDSETTNIVIDGKHKAFPILHQLGILRCDIEEIDASNVEDMTDVSLYRHSLDLYARLDEICDEDFDYVPIILCHNLSFDMYGLSNWFMRHDVKVLAKSARKPITFTVSDDNGKPCLVIWDTLIFTQQPLERMGSDCRYDKGIGEWDYMRIRTPKTPLTVDEIDYSKRDIYTLLSWFGWFLKRNPDIKPDRLGLNVVTKTGIVRERRRIRFDSVRGKGLKYNIGRYWLFRCRTERPRTDDELFTMFAVTRGGFTFCASKSANVPYDLKGTDLVVAGYDATSQHPAQMVSHLYPCRFHETTTKVLDLAFDVITKISVQRVLNRWDKPFPVAFNACFEFRNLRPKQGTVYERCGVFPLASARYITTDDYDEDNGDRVSYIHEMQDKNYRDELHGAKCAFGKIISAEYAKLYITELTAFEICQCYVWDSVRAVHGYITGRFTKPSDMDICSVMQFYKAKDAFKAAREEYYSTGTISNDDDLKNLGVAPVTVDEMKTGVLSGNDVESTYLGLKADLNALFGINASNEYRRDTVLTEVGIGYKGEFGLCNAPKNSKVWYQFGQRIVGWSRIAQICSIELAMRHAETLVNGDTDSIKVLCHECDLQAIDRELKVLARAIDKGKEKVCRRVRNAYPDIYSPLTGIGHYVCEFTTKRFCAAFNKAYVLEEKGHLQFTLAGVPTKRRTNKISSFIGVNGLADRFMNMGWSFGEVCDLFLGFNVTYANDVIRLNARSFPEWGDVFYEKVTDDDGVTVQVAEPSALALYPMSKTINDTHNQDNRNNLVFSLGNRDSVNVNAAIIHSGGVYRLDPSEVFHA